jgi:hypothetical protein
MLVWRVEQSDYDNASNHNTGWKRYFHSQEEDMKEEVQG